MNKLEIISTLKNEANISKSEAARVVQILFDNMAEAMAQGERVEIRVAIEPKKLPFFKSGKELKERVNY